jgi:hypothetical protein
MSFEDRISITPDVRYADDIRACLAFAAVRERRLAG